MDIPKRTHPINIVLCLDGTSNQFGITPISNCLKLFQLLEKLDPHQVCYYQPGVGVKFSTQISVHDSRDVLNTGARYFARVLDSMFAFTFEIHVKAAYLFLMRFYQQGDRIFLIGFSRGSFAARILAGMLESVGLLNPGLEDMVSTAWEIYCSWENAGQPDSQEFESSLANKFHTTFCRPGVKVHFMGLFDTVNSIGLFRDKMFPYVSKTTIVNHVRHAISLDERRDLNYQDDCVDTETSWDTFSDFISRLFGRSNHKRHGRDCDCTDIKELWFPGNHGDIGGGWHVDDITKQSLSNLSLRWMITQCKKYGITFKDGAIKQFNDNHPNRDSFLGYDHDCLRCNGDPEEYQDPDSGTSTSKTYSQANNSNFWEAVFWWLIELLPLGIKLEDANGEWKNYYIPNLGRPRKVPNDAKLHWSVFYRLHYFPEYSPTNLPPELGRKFLDSLPENLITDQVKEYASNLTIESIKSDNDIWTLLPDDLTVE